MGLVPEWHRETLNERDHRVVRQQRLDDVVLHASDDGRALYEQLGFVLTNEMRLRGGKQPA